MALAILAKRYAVKFKVIPDQMLWKAVWKSENRTIYLRFSANSSKVPFRQTGIWLTFALAVTGGHLRELSQFNYT